jgi:hypothetical protein
LANDANRVVIGGTPDAPSLPPIKIPVGYEWLAGLGFFAFGVYGLMRVRRRRAQQG